MRGILVSLVLFAFVASVHAAPVQCYRANEIEADQAVQYQSELMVISVACKTKDYVDFLLRNRTSVIDYQHAMMDHFKRVGERSGQAALDRYMTKLANDRSLEYSYTAGLCTRAADFLTSGGKLDGPAFHQLVAARAVDQSAAYRRCK